MIAARWMKFPPVLAYLSVGLILSPHHTIFPITADIENLEVWSDLGIIFLMFALGLEFSFKKLLDLGPRISINGFLEVAIQFFLGFITAKFFEFNLLQSIFLATCLAFSSSSVTLRTLKALDLSQKLFTRNIFGLLIFEDIFAISGLVLLTALAQAKSEVGHVVVQTLLQLIFFLGLFMVLGISLIPLLLRFLRNKLNDEFLLILSVGLCLSSAWLSTQAGFSSALGAFMMGAFLGSTIEGHRILEKIQPLQDLFVAIFFVSVGMLADFKVVWQQPALVLALTLIVICGKWVINTVLSIFSGVSITNSLIIGASLTQIGEFSFLIAKLGSQYKVVNNDFLPIIVSVAILTSLASSIWVKTAVKLSNSKYFVKLDYDNWLNLFDLININANFNFRKNLFKFIDLRFFLNTLIIFALALFSDRILLNFLNIFFIEHRQFVFLFSILFFCISTLPFIRAMLLVNTGTKRQKNYSKDKHRTNIQIFIFRLLATFILITLLMRSFLDLFPGILMSGVTLMAVFLLNTFLKRSYEKMEKQFQNNLNEVERKVNESTSLNLPWNIELIPLKVSADSEFIGKPLSQLRTHENWTLRIALIIRGSKKILAPKAQDLIYPGDQLFVLGDFEDIENFRKKVEFQASASNDIDSDYGLDSFVVSKDDPWCNLKIAESNIREEFDALIVGVESQEQRIVNPASDFLLSEGSRIWLVGSKKLIREFRWSR